MPQCSQGGIRGALQKRSRAPVANFKGGASHKSPGSSTEGTAPRPAVWGDVSEYAALGSSTATHWCKILRSFLKEPFRNF